MEFIGKLKLLLSFFFVNSRVTSNIKSITRRFKCTLSNLSTFKDIFILQLYVLHFNIDKIFYDNKNKCHFPGPELIMGIIKQNLNKK